MSPPSRGQAVRRVRRGLQPDAGGGLLRGVFQRKDPRYQKMAQLEFRCKADARGRFVRGNKGGPGNPLVRHVASLRAAIVRHMARNMTPDNIEQLLKKLWDMGMDGDVAAAKLYLSYTVGKPFDATDLENQGLEGLGLADELAETGSCPQKTAQLDVN
jgi:hypothetical protein